MSPESGAPPLLSPLSRESAERLVASLAGLKQRAAPEEVSRRYEELLALCAGYPDLQIQMLCELGGYFLERGERSGAEGFFRRALDSGIPDARKRAEAKLGLARIHKMEGRREEVLCGFQEILREHGAHFPDLATQLHRESGYLHLEGGDLDGAERELRAALALCNGDARERAAAHLGLACVARGRNRLEEALRIYGAAAAAGTPPDLQVLAYTGMGNLCLERNRIQEAGNHFRAALGVPIEDEDARAEARYGLASVLRRQGRKEEALREYARLLDRPGPALKPPHLELGELLLEMERPQEAFDCFGQELAAVPADPVRSGQAELGLAAIERRRGELMAALSRCRKLSARAPLPFHLAAQLQEEIGRLNLAMTAVGSAAALPAPAHLPTRLPYEYEWKIIDSCNYRCSYCCAFVSEFPRLDEMPGRLVAAERWIEAWMRLYELYGPAKIIITGGEPTTYPDFLELMAALSRVYRIAFDTNLSKPLPWVEEFIRRVPADRVRLGISFHDEFATMEDFAPKVERLRDAGFEYKVHLVCHPAALSRIKGHRRRLLERGLSVVPYPFRGRFEGRLYPQAYTEEERAVIEEMAGGLESKFEFWVSQQMNPINPEGKSCLAGHRYMRVESSGVIWRCNQYLSNNAPPIGTIFDPSFRLQEKAAPCESRSCGCEWWWLEELYAKRQQ